MPILYSINDIQSAMLARGSHWWDHSTMKFFGCKVYPEVLNGPGGIYFVTAENQFDANLPKRFTVRQFIPEDADIKTIGEMGQHATKREARKVAMGLASSDTACGDYPAKPRPVRPIKFAHKPITIMDQFVHDIEQHCPLAGRNLTLRTSALRLIQLAGRHHKYMEAQCNGTWPYGKDHDYDEGHPKIVEDLRRDAIQMAEQCGAKGVQFGGDPRGCTMKLLFHDGATNDFGKEGWCVPTALKDGDE